MTPGIARLLAHSSRTVLDHYLRPSARERLDRHVLKEARADLDRWTAALHDLVDAERLESYRAYVGAVVATVSPLLIAVCEQEGRDLDALVHAMRPDAPWDPWVCGARSPGKVHRRRPRRVSLGALSPVLRDRCELDWFAHAGAVFEPRSLGGVRFGVRVLDRGLEMAAMLGEARLRTHGSTGSLTIREELPATLAAALPGRALDDLVEHPLLAGAGCIVTRVDDPDFWGTKLRFSLEPVAWTMPWARL